MDDLAEESYWRFDARRKGYGPWKEAPQSERDAYKAELAALRAQLAKRDAEVGHLLTADGWLVNERATTRDDSEGRR